MKTLLSEEEYKSIKDIAHTKEQLDKIESVYKTQNYSETARLLNVSEATVRHSIKRLKYKATQIKLLQGDNAQEVEDNYPVKGTSTMYDEDGKVKLQWVKRDKAKDDMIDAYKEAIENIASKADGKACKSESPTMIDSDKMTVYTIGDAHIGMLAWHREVGEDHDLEKAENDLIVAMQTLTSQSQQTEEAFIVDVGDWFHSDNMENKTARSGNALDVDGRYPKVLEIGLSLTTKLIDIALSKHKIVRWRSAIGNHDEHSAIMMSAFIKAYYRNEPRVIVHDTPNMFMYHKFGKNLIGVTHGHTAKADKLGEIMSVDCEDIWSETKYRYWYTGHIHHQSVKEYPSCVVETFRTLAGKDAWHSASGYRSGQDMRSITLHKEYGEISRNTVNLHFIRNNK